MIALSNKLLLIGDNPFHGISHLSQERARSRTSGKDSVINKADVVAAAIKKGADGFSFSVSEVTLSILNELRDRQEIDDLKLYPIVPYAFEYVRIATQTGTPGLAKKVAKQIAFSGDAEAVFNGLGALLTMKPESILKTYLAYEISKIRSATSKKAVLSSILLHEVVTDMGLALNFRWLFTSYISYLRKKTITPGFNTRNFPYLVKKFTEWNINLEDTLIQTQFNKAGFQMNPSREEYEKTLSNLSTPIVLAISVLAAGYFKPSEAIDYLIGLTNLKGAVVGASTVEQANETFGIFGERLKNAL